MSKWAKQIVILLFRRNTWELSEEITKLWQNCAQDYLFNPLSEQQTDAIASIEVSLRRQMLWIRSSEA